MFLRLDHGREPTRQNSRFAHQAWVVFGFSSVLSCSPDPQSKPRPIEEAAFQLAAADEIELTRGEFLSAPVRIAVHGNVLIIIDAVADSAVHIINRHNGQHIRSFGRRGEGPGEYAGPWSIARDPTISDAFWIYDIRLRRLTRQHVHRLIQPPSTAEILLLRTGTTTIDPVFLDASKIVFAGAFLDGRLGFLDLTTGQVRTAARFPVEAEYMAPRVQFEIHQPTLSLSPDRSRIAIASRYAALLALYTADGDSIAAVTGPTPFEIVFETRINTADGGANVAHLDETRFGYVDVAAAEGLVYALFSGRSRGQYGRQAVKANRVDVFDWSGKHIRRMLLPSDVSCLAVSEEGETLYLVTEDPVPRVVAYNFASGSEKVQSRRIGEKGN